ncbi:uncharacterized protein VP01_4147g1 [Puccinia sorghi]|uniref:Uncharacterized protein n=1 Tax=Puccinia sorghi TaxID=27349 RepID=A0A0L6UR10_9BASI|nr:uncharacterized protein VP01_4147g1 [Puccinia sorghi]
MVLASEAAAQLDLLALLPPDPAPSVHLHPLSTSPVLASPPQRPSPRDPDAMEIDATCVHNTNHCLLDVSQALCRSRNLCFRCLSPIVPGMHIGSLNCPNPPVSVERRQAFVGRTRSTSRAQVSSITPSLFSPTPLTYAHPADSAPVPSPECVPNNLDSHSFNEGGFDEMYEDYDEEFCATVLVPVSTVHICLNCSVGI